MSPEGMSFDTYQAAFAARIRDPRATPLPIGAPAGRMRVYEELLFNNLEGFLLSCYPVTRRILGTRIWKKTVRRFFAEYRCDSPLFRDIPEAFLDWMMAHGQTLFPTLPFVYEFMHYEWMELVVSISPEEVESSVVNTHGNLLDGFPALNPTARLACYNYPVHRIGPRFKPKEPDGHTWCFLLHRDTDDTVHFTAVNTITARLIELLQSDTLTGRQSLVRIAAEIGHPEPDAVVTAGTQILLNLHRNGAIAGTRRKKP